MPAKTQSSICYELLTLPPYSFLFSAFSLVLTLTTHDPPKIDSHPEKYFLDIFSSPLVKSET